MFIYYIEEALTAGMIRELKYIDGGNKETNSLTGSFNLILEKI